MPVNHESILNLLRLKAKRPLKIAEIAKALHLADEHRRNLRQAVKLLLEDGRLIQVRGGRVGLPDEMNLVSGTLTGNPNGYAFVTADDPEHTDIYINPRNLGGAMHRDRVIARIESHRHQERPEGVVIRVLERKNPSLVGAYESFKNHGRVIPADPKHLHEIFVAASDRNKAKPGQLVCVEITEYPTRHQPPAGRVTEILGYPDDPEAEIRAIIRKHGIVEDFPYEVAEEVKKLTDAIDPEERAGRLDLTGHAIFTIDGERAKDFDDAVSLEKTAHGYRLGVHIADVSHFVRDGTPLDREAGQRGTSIYYPDAVIPMLPFALSNEICSLKPNKERLTLSVFINYTPAGDVLDYRLCKSIIKSAKRFTYTEAHQLLQGEAGPGGGEEHLLPILKDMLSLSQTLRQLRILNGSVDFHLPEPEIILDPSGKVQSIAAAPHNTAHELIEEFMLAANQVVAKHMTDHDIPGIHRVHEPPEPGKLEDFNDFIKGFGLNLTHIENIKSRDLQKLLKKARNRPEEKVINTLLLRAMKKAQYSPHPKGHFCLGFQHYLHFTSPIRRYPDLVTHRLLKSFLHRKCSARAKQILIPRIAQWSDQSSRMEIKSMEVEREINNLRRAQFMADKTGKIFDGAISSVTAFGFFVELSGIFVEGLVHISSLADDYYIHIEPEHKLAGKYKRRVYRIGDPVTVRLAKVDIAKRQIDFILVKHGR